MTDRTTLWGVLGLLGLLAAVLVVAAGREAVIFWQGPSLLLIIGGMGFTAWSTRPHWPLRSIYRLLRNALVVRRRSPEDMVALMVVLADTARRDGLLALDRLTHGLNDEFLKRSLRMAVDGHEPALIESVARAEMERIDLRYTEGTTWLESVGRSAPVFGMIGTLIGLILMLSKMQDPAHIGPGMAVAMLTTLYGLVLPNVCCYPLARRLTYVSSDELLIRTMALQGTLAIQAGDNPRLVEQKLRAYLPPVETYEAEAGLLMAPTAEVVEQVEQPVPSKPSKAGKVSRAVAAWKSWRGSGAGATLEEAA